MSPAPAGPVVAPDGSLSFHLPVDLGFQPISVWFHLADFGADTRFRPATDHDGFVARIPRPPVARMEYLLEVEYPGGHRGMIPDPTNPRRARGVFGDHSLVEWPDYRTPWWLDVLAKQPGLELSRDPSADDPGGGAQLSPATQLLAGTTWVRPEPPGTGEGIASVRLAQDDDPGDERRRRAPGGWSLARDGADTSVVDPRADVVVRGQLHVPADSIPAEPLPLLVVHDGPEYAELAHLLGYLGVLTHVSPALRTRVLLMSPVERDRSYSASPGYARALVRQMLPQVRTTVRTVGPVVGLGASLGGLALLHAAVTYPGTFGGILSQSGSFFLPRTDDKERGYRFYQRIVRFVESVDADPDRLAGLHVSLTCGTGEENLANNRPMARRLARAGATVCLFENADGHNYTGWRDCLDPQLRNLLTALWT